MADDNKEEGTPPNADAAARSDEPEQYPRQRAVSVSPAAPKGNGGRRFLTLQADGGITVVQGSDAREGDDIKLVAPLQADDDGDTQAQLNSSADIQPLEPDYLQADSNKPSSAEIAAPSNVAAAAIAGRARQSRRADAKTALREEVNLFRSEGASQAPGAVSVTGSVAAGTASIASAGGDSKVAAPVRAEVDALRNQSGVTSTAPVPSRNNKAAIKQEIEALRGNPEMNRPGAHSVASKAASAASVKGGGTRVERPSRRAARGNQAEDTKIKGSAGPKAPPAVTPGAVSETSKPSQKSAEVLKAGGPYESVFSLEKEKAATHKLKATTGAVSATGDEKSKILKGDDGAIVVSPSEGSSKKLEMLAQEQNGIVGVGVHEGNRSLEASFASLGKEGSSAHVGASEEELVAAQVIDEEELEAQYQAKMMKDVVAAEIVSEDELKERGRCWKATCCCLFSIGIILAVAIPLTKKNKIPTAPPTAAPTAQTDYEYLLDLFYPYSGEALGTNATAQYQALEWLAFEDPLNLPFKEVNQSTLLERYAAAVVYYSFNGWNWTTDYDFLSNKSICEWNSATTNFGIFCEQTGEHAERIEIDNNGLNGTIPTEFLAFSRMSIISFSNGGLHGSLPSELGDMTSLTFLQIATHALTGSIPDSYQKLDLSVINLNQNLITGTVPQKIMSTYQNMFAAIFAENLLEGPLPPMNRESAMLFAYFGQNFFEGSIPPSYMQQHDMQLLSLEDNNLTGTIPEQIQALVNLNYFYAQNNQMTGSIPTTLSALSNSLEEFLIGSNKFNGTLASQLGQLRSLTRLSLGNNSFTGSLPSEFGNLQKITSMDLSLNHFTGTIPITFSQLTTLSQLDLSFTNIVDGANAAFCDRPLVVTSVKANCLDNSTLPCSCCTSCCDEITGDCQVNVLATCEAKMADFELAPGRGTNCSCSEKSSVRMSCEDNTCESCNVDGSVCVKGTDYGYDFNATTGAVTSFHSTLQYVKGRNDTLVYHNDVNSDTCELTVNGKKCAYCGIIVCASGVQGFTIECSNLPGGPSMGTCADPTDAQYLEAFFMLDPSLLSGCAPVIVDIRANNGG